MRGISVRAILIGLVMVVAVCAIVSWAELVVAQIQIGFLQLPPVAIGLLVLILGGNALMRHIARRAALSPPEIMTIYSMMILAAMISSRGLMEKWLPTLVAVDYYGSPESGWQRLFFPYIKKWMVPFNPGGVDKQDVAKWFYEGLHHGEPIPWQLWIYPLACWLILIAFIFLGFLCLAALLRRQWVDNERLTFPLAQLPLEMARSETSGPFFRNYLTWFGFAIPAIVFTVNGISQMYPSVPTLTTQHHLNQYFTIRPWSDMDYTVAFVSFAAIGFSYLLPSDLLFSLWFFFAFSRIEDVIASAFGMQMDGMPLYPTKLYKGYQVMGAYVVLVGYLVRMMWPHLRLIWRKVVTNDPEIDDSQEFIPYRVAFWGLIIAVAGSVSWCYMAGMSLWVAVLEVTVYLLIVCVVMARSVAEGGLIMTESSFRPVNFVSLVTNKAALGPQNLTAMAFFDTVFPRDLRGLLLTGFLDGLKIGDGVHIRRRSMLRVFLIAMVLAIVVAAVIHLWIPYRQGGVTLYSYVYPQHPTWNFKDNIAAARGETHFDWRAPTFFVIGCAFTLFLATMRANFYGWPFHPLGYALSSSWTMIVFWFPIFIAWILKTLILRYGGMKLYVRARPLFLGLVLGEFTSAVLWTVFAMITRLPVSPTMPWP